MNKKLSKKIIFAISGLVVGCSLAGTLALSTPHAYADAKSDLCAGVNAVDNPTGTTGCGDTSTTIDTTIRNIITLLSRIVGLIAIIMVIVAGFRYITANGDASKAASARTTIIYALIGIVIVVFSQAIIYFVLNRVPAK